MLIRIRGGLVTNLWIDPHSVEAVYTSDMLNREGVADIFYISMNLKSGKALGWNWPDEQDRDEALKEIINAVNGKDEESYRR